MGKNKNRGAAPAEEPSRLATIFARKSILWWLPILYFFISDAFYLRTYDSAQVKITLVQMGGICLAALWLCRLIGEGRKPFTRSDLVTLAPFLAYFAYGIFSYVHAPYKFSSLDALLRRIFYMTVPLIVIREFHQEASSRLIRILIWTTWITVGYGCLQWFDIKFFPPGIGKGPDPFIWRQAFGPRVFSTFGNPNFFADFLVIMFPVIVCQYLKTRDFKLIPLLGMLLLDLFATQTKGAWVAMVISTTLFSATYVFFFARNILQQYWKHMVGVCLLFSSLVGGAVIHKLNTSNWTSVTFRLFTWEATWEMIMTQPLIGTGIGSFWVIYPAFRRPPIFHIEGKHNTETDHSENEWLEVLYDEGILGFGIFIWLIFTTCIIAYGALGQLTGSLKKGQRAPPRAYDILGFLIALQGMLAHNFFDVSMRFVSSGVYLGLLSGLVVNLSRGHSLYELHRDSNEPVSPGGGWQTFSSFLIWPARLAAWGGLAYVGWGFFSQFKELQGPLFRMRLGGEILQWWIAWASFLFIVLVQVGIFARVALLARNALIPLVIVGMLFPLRLAWGFFRADVHHNIAIFWSKKQNWEQALKNYFIVGGLNPAFVMSFYFKGNVFNDRFNMERIYNQNWGDKDGKPRTDFERAIAAYDEVRANAPNYVQMHHQMGVLHMKRGQWEQSQANKAAGEGRQTEAARHVKASDEFYLKAIEYFELYRKHDPVFRANYYRMAQAHMLRKDHAKMIATYETNVAAPQCRVDPKLSGNKLLRNTILRYQPVVRNEETGIWEHGHFEPEPLTHLGNGYYLTGQLKKAADAFQRALKINPKNQHARNNLKVVLSAAQKQGRLKMSAPKPGQTGLPAFEIMPSK